MPKKVFALGLIIIVSLLTGAFPAAGEDVKNDLNLYPEMVNLSKEIDLSQVKDLLHQIDRDVQKSLPDFSLAKIFEDLKNGKLNLNPENIGQKILIAIGREIVVNAPLIAKLLVLAVLCAIINQLQLAFNGSVSKTARMLAYLVLLGLAVASFQIALDIGSSAIESMVSFMQAILPVMFTILLVMGNITSAALFKPLVMGSLVFLATLIKTIVLPLFFLSAVLRLFNNISQQFKLTKFAELLEFGGKLCIGLVLTIFIGVMSVEGVTGGVADGVTLRTAKYSADLIPVVGKYFKDAVELVASSGLLLKNALGIVTLLGIILIILAPIIKIIAMMFTFKISAALVEPLGEKDLAESLQDMSKGLLYIFAAVSSVAVMFFITTAIVIGTGNLSVMLR